MELKNERTWLVRAVNCDAVIDLDPKFDHLPIEIQALQASAKAVAAFNGLVEDIPLKFDGTDTVPQLGTVLTVLKQSDPRTGIMVATPFALANLGFVEDALEMAKHLDAQLTAIENEAIQNGQPVPALREKLSMGFAPLERSMENLELKEPESKHLN